MGLNLYVYYMYRHWTMFTTGGTVWNARIHCVTFVEKVSFLRMNDSKAKGAHCSATRTFLLPITIPNYTIHTIIL